MTGNGIITAGVAVQASRHTRHHSYEGGRSCVIITGFLRAVRYYDCVLDVFLPSMTKG